MSPISLSLRIDHDVRLYQARTGVVPALVEAMDAALFDIQFETYIFDSPARAAGVALVPVRRRGVCTHLVVDGERPPAGLLAAPPHCGRGGGGVLFRRLACCCSARRRRLHRALQGWRRFAWRHQSCWMGIFTTPTTVRWTPPL